MAQSDNHPEYGVLNDAKLLTLFSQDDPRYAQNMVISTGGSRESQHWLKKAMPVAQLVALLSFHHEDKSKDGLAFVLAQILGSKRIKTAVAACYGVGLDIDVGVPGAVIDAALVKFGCLAVRYTTHSHGKTSTKMLKNRITRWATKNGMDEVNREAIVRFLREDSRWDESVIETVEYIRDVQEPEGFMVELHHAPMEKHRIVMPLVTPFEPTKEGKTHDEGMKKWGQVCHSLAKVLGDLPLDRSATDPSRLFYFPRHAPGAAHETTIIGGDLLDWQALDLGTAGGAAESGGSYEVGTYRSKSTTQEGRDLGRWSRTYAERFQALDVIKDYAGDHVRTPGAHKIDIMCPFDEEHSDPGNPEDKGCFVVNAGDGPSPVFIIKCQHDSCSQRTNLDHLGKMLKDEWFDREALDDDAYNPELGDDAAGTCATTPLAATAQGFNRRPLYEEVLAAANALTHASHPDDIGRVIADTTDLIAPAEIAKIKKALKSKAGLNQSDFDRARKQVMREKAQGAQDGPSNLRVDANGVTIFEYWGAPNEFDQLDAVKALAGITLAFNDLEAERHPYITSGPQGVMKMDRTLDGRVIFKSLKAEQLRAAVNGKIALVRINEDGTPGPRKHLPSDITNTFYNTAHHHLPLTPEILRTPAFMEDGTLARSEGWDETRGIYADFAGFEVPPIPENPSVEQVADALSVLRDEMLVGFPFLAFDREGKERRGPAEAAGLAMMLTPFMRRMIKGHTPLFFVSKPMPGTGGSLLGGIPTRLYEGRDPVPTRHEEGNDAENNKELLSAASEGRTVLFYDDVKNFNSRVIILALTSDVIAGRRLGANETIEAPNAFLWIGTGNNPNFGREMIRRTAEIRLNARTHDIETIKHDRDLLTWIPANRSRIVGAILTLIQNWIDKGKPPFTTRSLASFENWAKAVGGVLQAAGIHDLLDVMRPAETDFAIAADKKFVADWLGKFGFEKTSVQELVDRAISIEADICEGYNDSQKKQRLPGRLATMLSVTYNLGTKEKPKPITVIQTTDAEDNLAYQLAEVEPVAAHAVEAADV